MSIYAIVNKCPADPPCIEGQTYCPVDGTSDGRPTKQGTPVAGHALNIGNRQLIGIQAEVKLPNQGQLKARM